MGLLRQQEALAVVLMQAQERKAFAQDPTATLRSLGLRGNDLALLASLDADDLAYFATRRNIDRYQALRADAPLTLRLLEATRGRVQAYFRTFPFSLEDPRAETKRFATWCVRAARDGTVPALAPDLARYEAAVLDLLARKPRAAPPSTKPRRAPGLVRFMATHRLQQALRSKGIPKATPNATPVVVQRTADDVRWNVLTPLEAALVDLADGKRTQATWLKQATQQAGATLAEARKAAAGLRRDGLLAPAL